MSALPPVYMSDSRILILGSMPGKKSLEQSQYYAHPQNSFWPIVLSGGSLSSTLVYAERLANLLKNRIALWDVLADCKRPGSLDSKIVRGSEVFNPLDQMIEQLPNLRAVFFNGKKAQMLFDRRFKYLKDIDDLAFETLPSTSPAHAAMSVSQKSMIWHAAIARYIDPISPNLSAN